MGTDRRLAALLLALGLIGAPAAVLRVGCVGASCRPAAVAAAPAPFCSLPADLRALVGAGTYEGRSPDVMAVAGSTPVVSDIGGGVEVPWPSADGARRSAMSVPLRFFGRGIRNGKIPAGVTLDRVAPTLEPVLGLRRAHPDVRSGTAIPDVSRSGVTSPLVILIAWRGVGRSDEQRYYRRLGDHLLQASLPALRSSSDRTTYVEGEVPPYLQGVGSSWGAAEAGSLPMDPIAVEATIGTGGLPYQHGITGTRIRDPDTGRVVAALGPGAPQPVIATLGDDLDLATDGAARIGLIASAPGDAALTGDAWYGIGSILDRRVRVHPDVASDIDAFLAAGWGDDVVPDLLGVALSGSFGKIERATRSVLAHVLRAVPDATLVVAGTGTLITKQPVTASAPAGADAIAAGGTFLGRGPAAVPAQSVVDELRAQNAPDGSSLYVDAFASYAVRFARYC